MLGGRGGCLPPPPANYWVGSYSFIITSPTLAGERMLLIPKVSILSEQTNNYNKKGNNLLLNKCLNFEGNGNPSPSPAGCVLHWGRSASRKVPEC